MNKKTTTTSEQKTTRDFDPASMEAYQTMLPQARNVLTGYMTDPLKSTYFQTLFGRTAGQAQALGARSQGNILQRAQMFGGGSTPAFLQAQMGRAERGTSGLQSNALLDALKASLGAQQWATGQAMGFQPLELGQSSTGKSVAQESGGWLGPLLAAAIGAAGSAFTGGATGLLGKGSSALTRIAAPAGALGGMNIPNNIFGTFRGLKP